MTTERDRVEILFEQVNDQYQIIREGLDALSGVPAKLDALTEDVDILKRDMVVVKSVLKSHSAILKDHSRELKNIHGILRVHTADIAELKAR